LVTSRALKDCAYAELAQLAQAFATPKRLELIDLLAQGPRTVELLALEADLSLANASRHLKQLRSVGLVRATKQGLYVEYRLADAAVASFAHALVELARTRMPELARVAGEARERWAEAPLDADTLAALLEHDALLLDVRPQHEYEAGHLAGARSIPLAQLRERLRELPADRRIVVYCRGPWCAMAGEAATLLREHGFEAAHVELGVVDWRVRGGEVVVGAAP
jgi:rhodanese-related sulfurtransferase